MNEVPGQPGSVDLVQTGDAGRPGGTGCVFRREMQLFYLFELFIGYQFTISFIHSFIYLFVVGKKCSPCLLHAGRTLETA